MSAEQSYREDTGSGPDTSRYLDYLKTNRDFTISAVAAAVGSIELAESDSPVRVLDAGTGAGGALPDLAELVRATGRAADGSLTAIDLSEQAVELVKAEVIHPDLTDVVEARVADLEEVAAEAAAEGGVFDLIWSSDVVWPAAFDSPAATVQTLADALLPGGVLALFTTNYYQSMFLPGHSRIERLIRTASELTWGLPHDGSTHYERLGPWMREAGLLDVRLGVFPVVASTVAEPTARVFLEQIVWPEMRHAVESQGRAAGMTDADVARAEELLDPDSPSWVGADHTSYVVQPTLLWTGRAPA